MTTWTPSSPSSALWIPEPSTVLETTLIFSLYGKILYGKLPYVRLSVLGWNPGQNLPSITWTETPQQ